MDDNRPPNIGRRELFYTGAIAVAGCAPVQGQTASAATMSLKQGATLLFQGDSITFTGRDRNRQEPNTPHGLGYGYAEMVAGHLIGKHPKLALECHNRGISGNKVPELAGRWEEDTIDLQPDILSILIGINDVWHKLAGPYEGTADTYEAGYTDLLKRTRKALKNTTFVVCEPFALQNGLIKSDWMPEIDAYRAAAKRVADAAGAIWVPFQSVFNDAITDATPPEYWAGDGVHPTMAGHALMARAWLEATGLAD